MVEGHHLAFTSLLVLVHRFNWLAINPARGSALNRYVLLPRTSANSLFYWFSGTSFQGKSSKHLGSTCFLSNIYVCKCAALILAKSTQKGQSLIMIRVSCSVWKYGLPSARYHGLWMRQNLVQWFPQIEWHMTGVGQSEVSKS